MSRFLQGCNDKGKIFVLQLNSLKVIQFVQAVLIPMQNKSFYHCILSLKNQNFFGFSF